MLKNIQKIPKGILGRYAQEYLTEGNIERHRHALARTQVVRCMILYGYDHPTTQRYLSLARERQAKFLRGL